jgi:mannonate dehydratase
MGTGAAFRYLGAQFRHSGIYAPHPETDAVFPHDYSFDQGMLYVGDTPGHGVDIDEALAAKYPYKPAYLARRPPGRRHDVELVI